MKTSYALGLLTVVLTSASVWADSSLEAQLRTHLREGCMELGKTTIAYWLTTGESERRTCLDSGAIPTAELTSMIEGFIGDCAESLLEGLRPQMDGRKEMNMEVSREELSELFLHRYEPYFQRYCR